MREIKNLTMIIADCSSIPQAIHSIKKSLSIIKPERVILFTSMNIPSTNEYEVILIEELKSKEDYSRWICRELYKHITTDYVWICQWDSWALDADAWDDDFLSIDYIGASWNERDGFSVGNGGGSIRSRRLMEAVANDPVIVATHPEDVQLCRTYRPHLEAKYGFKWASEELADKFSFEIKAPTQSTFTFHSFFHKPYQKTVVINRTGALGDVIMTEPLMHYYYKKGYRVVLKTLPQFYNIFAFHYFKIHHPDEIDQRLLKDAKYINLDLGYEITPERLHLESYYKNTGIEDGEIRNPQLTLQFDPKDPNAKLFKKYCVIHLDRRLQPGRNAYGIDWTIIVRTLQGQGYQVIQIGQGEREVIEQTIQIQNTNELLLMRLIGGADLFIGCDSGPSNIAIAMNTPAIIFFGSVNPSYIIPDETNVIAISKHRKGKICSLPYCWSSKIGTEGVECVEINGVKKLQVQSKQGSECVETSDIPPCVQFSTEEVIEAINKMINKHE